MPRVSEMVRRNQAHYCTVPGCSRHRTALSRWCNSHFSTYERTGAPTGQAINPKHWASYRARIREVYHVNASHPGLTRALQLLNAWMAEAVEKDGRQKEHWATEVARVCRHGCSALDILVELAACWCFLQDSPRAAPSDTQRNWALSRAVLSLAPRPRRVTPEAAAKGSNGYAPKARPSVLRHIGPHLVQLLGPLLVTTHRSLQTEATRAQEEVQAMRADFSPTPTAIARAAQSATNHPIQ